MHTSDSLSPDCCKNTRLPTLHIPVPIYPADQNFNSMEASESTTMSNISTSEACSSSTNPARRRMSECHGSSLSADDGPSRPPRPKSEYFPGSTNSNPTARSNRLQERIQASLDGIKQLDALREKHRRMIMETIKTDLNDETADAQKDPGGDAKDKAISRVRASSPNLETGSHRSSLSIDSGILSLASDPVYSDGGSQMLHCDTLCHDNLPYDAYFRRLHTASGNLLNSSSEVTVSDLNCSNSNQSESNSGDDEGIYSEGDCVPRAAQYYQILNVEPSPCTPPLSPTGSKFGSYAKRAHTYRSRALYSYPEENTVLVTSPQIATVKIAGVDATSSLNMKDVASPDRVRSSSVIYQSPPSSFSPATETPMRRRTSLSTSSTGGYQKRSPIERRISEIKNARESEAAALFRANCVYVDSGANPEDTDVSPLRQSHDHLPGYRQLMTRHPSLAVLTENRYSGSRSQHRPKSLAIAGSSRNILGDSDTEQPFVMLQNSLKSASMCHLNYPSSTLTPHTPPKHRAPSVRRRMSNVSQSSDRTGERTPTPPDEIAASITPTDTMEKIHVVLSRTISAQSTESTRSRRSREKSWHESEEL